MKSGDSYNRATVDAMRSRNDAADAHSNVICAE